MACSGRGDSILFHGMSCDAASVGSRRAAEAKRSTASRMVISMFHPDQFQVNEAWIVFLLNDAPLQTKSEGDCNCLALMDAASCFILTSAVVPANVGEPSELEARRLLKNGYAHKQEMPKTLFIPNELRVANLALEAQRQKIRIIRVPEDQLLIFIGDAKEGFRERFDPGNAR